MAAMEERSGDQPYELVVIGRGLVGGAAARHAAEAGHSVALVGPMEGASQASCGIYGCHADEGRICRRLDVDGTWAALASRSMDRYGDIETRSGIRFHDAVGCLAVGRAGGRYLGAVSETARRRGLELEELNEAALRARWPRLRLDCTLLQDFKVSPAFDPKKAPAALRDELEADDSKADVARPPYAALFESGESGAGVVSPRRLLEAQVALATRAGAAAYNAAAERVTRNGDGTVKVELSDGRAVLGRRCLVCTNAFTNFRPLLPRVVDLELTTQTVRRRAYAPADARRALGDMPAVIVKGGDMPYGAPSTHAFDACYVLPPLDYGDGGGLSVKVGHGAFFERALVGEDEARAWYEKRDVEERLDSFARCELALVAKRVLRDPPEPVADATDRCVIPKTPTSRPYVHKFDQSLGCCVGCNGYAAKSSDELGRLAQRMMLKANWQPGDWDGDDIPQDAFTVVFGEKDLAAQEKELREHLAFLKGVQDGIDKLKARP